MSKRPIERLLALRILEEERAEAEIRKQRHLRQNCLDELTASEEASAVHLRALYAALHAGDRTGSIAAELALSFGPLQRRSLLRRLMNLEAMVETATMAWQHSRLCRLQVQTLAEVAATRLQQELEVRERKALDAWFLSRDPQGLRREDEYENFQREPAIPNHTDGIVRAESP
jgi:flagellar biosynthesis chaperone FliJ